MKKLRYALMALAAAPFAAMAEGTAILDTSDLETKVTQLTTDIKSFLTGPIGTMVLTIAAASLIVWLAIKLIKWGKRAAN